MTKLHQVFNNAWSNKIEYTIYIIMIFKKAIDHISPTFLSMTKCVLCCVFSRSTMLESHLMGSLVLLLLILRTESTNGILNSINDLKKIPFGQSVPQHSLVLLHWFANTIEIDNDLIELTFEPNHEDYGTHHYGTLRDSWIQCPSATGTTPSATSTP